MCPGAEYCTLHFHQNWRFTEQRKYYFCCHLLSFIWITLYYNVTRVNILRFIKNIRYNQGLRIFMSVNGNSLLCAPKIHWCCVLWLFLFFKNVAQKDGMVKTKLTINILDFQFQVRVSFYQPLTLLGFHLTRQ